MSFFYGLWPIVAKFGLAGLVVAGLCAFSFFSPVFKKTALWLAALVITTTIAYTFGVSDGEHRVKVQWDAAIDAAIKQGETARSDAERDIASEPPDSLRHDPHNRDRP